MGNCGIGGPKTADSTVNINVLGGPVVNSTIEGTQQTSWQSPQAVAADANGNYVVVWSSETRTATAGTSMPDGSMPSGNAQGNEFLVNTLKTAGDQMYATVAMNADGSFVITWTDLNGADGSADVYAKLYNADGSVQRDQFLVNTTTADDQMYTSVAMDANGGFVVTWSSQDAGRRRLGRLWTTFRRLRQQGGLGVPSQHDHRRRPDVRPGGHGRQRELHRRLAEPEPGQRRLGHLRTTVRLLGQRRWARSSASTRRPPAISTTPTSE